MKAITTIRNLLHPTLLLAVAAVINACTTDDIDNGVTPVPGKPGTLTVTVQSNKLLPRQVATRAQEPKDDEEKAINRFYLFFFDSEGNYLKSSETEERFFGFQTSQEGSSVMNIDSKAINSEQLDGEITVYAVANVEDGIFTAASDGTCEQIENLTELESYTYRPKIIGVTLPQNGMPMVGKGKITLNQTEANALTIPMKALMARIDINLSIKSDITTDDNLPRLSMTKWSAMNLPTSVCFTAPAEGESTTAEMTNVEDIPENAVIYNGNGEVNLSLYVLENLQPADLTDPDGTKEENWGWTGDYPQGANGEALTDVQKQRYKPCLSNGKATYIELTGNYYTYNYTAGEEGSAAYYEVTYTLHPGSNAIDDFNVRRNSLYRNNVVIKGLTDAGTNSEHITFDARVNIVEDNYYFISMLRERDHDAHFCITPMDIYLFRADEADVNPSMEVTLTGGDDTEGRPWIRMERIPAELMATGNVTSDADYNGTYTGGAGKWLDTGSAWHAGTGKRRWFTTGLMDELNHNTNERRGRNGTQCTMGHRDRIYFYLDENLGDSERFATVNLVYKENGTERSSRTVTIRQVPLLPVQVYSRNESGIDYDNPIHTIYMEQFEEYAQYYDPLDEFSTSAVYTGREWGNNNVRFGQARVVPLHNTNTDDLNLSTHGWYIDIFDNYYHGLDITAYECYRAGQLIIPDMNTVPRSAPEYCYNKNIRGDTNGSIPFSSKEEGWPTKYIKIETNEAKWFMPGIRQMEDALVQYQTTYPEFGDFYWSSSVAKDGNRQLTDRARATRVQNGYYVESADDADNYPRGGRALRTESLRIRAFRIDKGRMQ